MDTLEFIKQKYGLNLNQKSPIEIPNIGRNQMAGLFRELGFKKGLEVGVANGYYSTILMNANPDLVLWGVDPYEPHSGYRDFTHRETFNKMKSDAHNSLDRFLNYHFVEKYSKVAEKDFENGSLDFVYIDGDHCYQSVVSDIASWLPKIRKGGIISGDDYFRNKGNSRIHVVDAVNGWTRSWEVRPWFLVGRSAKIEGEIRDNGRSWFWVV